MSTIHVEQRHNLSPEEARQRVDEHIAPAATRINAEVRWTGDTAKFNGGGFSGTITLGPGVISMDIDLSIFLRPLKGPIEASVKRTFAQRFT